MTKRERIDHDVLHRRAPVAVLSGLAAGDDVHGLMAVAAPSHVPGSEGTTCCVPPAPLPTTSPKPAGETAPKWPTPAPRSPGGSTPPDPRPGLPPTTGRAVVHPPAISAASGGCSLGCSCGEFVAVRLRPLLCRKVSNPLVRGPSWTLADVRERDHDGLAAWGSGGSSPLSSTPQTRPFLLWRNGLSRFDAKTGSAPVSVRRRDTSVVPAQHRPLADLRTSPDPGRPHHRGRLAGGYALVVFYCG